AKRLQELVDGYGDGNDERLIEKVIKAHALLESLLDPQAWLAEARRRLAEPASGNFRESTLGRELEREIEIGIAAMRESCKRALAVVSEMKGFAKYVEDLQECAGLIEDWAGMLKLGGIDAVAANIDQPLPRLPSVPESTPGKQRAKELVD